MTPREGLFFYQKRILNGQTGNALVVLEIFRIENFAAGVGRRRDNESVIKVDVYFIFELQRPLVQRHGRKYFAQRPENLVKVGPALMNRQRRLKFAQGDIQEFLNHLMADQAGAAGKGLVNQLLSPCLFCGTAASAPPP